MKGGGVWNSGPQTDKHLPQSSFCWSIFRWQHFSLPSMSLIFLHYMEHTYVTQSIHSSRLSVQSSELGPPLQVRVSLSPLGPEGSHARLRGRGWGDQFQRRERHSGTPCINCRKIILVEGNAKCHHLKKLICNRTLGQLFIYLRLRTLYIFPIH